MTRANDKLISLFCELLSQNEEALKIAVRLPVPSRDMTECCARRVNIPTDCNEVCAFIMNGSDRVQDRIWHISRQR